MHNELILVVDDERDIRELIEYNLKRERYEVQGVDSGEAALAAVRNHQPGLILLDIMLPARDGLDVCRTLKADPATAGIPIIMVSAKGEEVDVVTGLELGAVDYITKPFSPRVLLARVRAALRRSAAAVAEAESAGGETPLRLHGVTLDPARRGIEVNGKSADLTRTEFDILQFLMRRPGWVFTRNQIIDALHGSEHAVTARAVDVQVVSLRRKLGTAGEILETVRGVGYRMKE